MNDIPMREIKSIIAKDLKPGKESFEDTEEILKRRIEAEELESIRHKKNAERLKLALKYYDRKEDTSELCALSFYRISEKRSDFKDTVRDWFMLSSKDEDMGLCYLCSEFDVSRTADENKNNDKGNDKDKNKNGERLISEKPKAGFLIIKDYELAAVKRPDLMEKTVSMSFESCIVRRIISKEPVPSMEEILKTLSLAEVYGMKAGGSIFSYFIHRYENKGSKAAEYLIELCMPAYPLK